MAKVELENVTKEFGDVTAVNDVSFTIDDGELIVLVGPSGCGKTTTLRMIAGLEQPTLGRVWIGGEDVTGETPGNRNIAMVFQDLALYPHKTVRENMEFPLSMKGWEKGTRGERVQQVAGLLEIEEMLDRLPDELSGGQQQRVALGRALVREPSVFLLDEPLASLDARLRTTMRAEILNIHQELEETMVYVTHDQEIAMTLGDRIAVMRQGEIQQFAEPTTVYDRPENEFVAQFIGSPDMNLVDARISVADDGVMVSTDEFDISLDQASHDEWSELDGEEIRLGIRPQDIHLADGHTQQEVIRGNIEIIEELGSVADIHCGIEGSGPEFIARVDNISDIEVNDTIDVIFDHSKLHFFDSSNGNRIKWTDQLLDSIEVDAPGTQQRTDQPSGS